jgi:hypothetical protein
MRRVDKAPLILLFRVTLQSASFNSRRLTTAAFALAGPAGRSADRGARTREVCIRPSK